MGLFDTIRCEYPLPDPRLQRAEFQTKDLDPALESYTITADGRLVRHARRIGGRAALDRDVEWPIHGDILIYTGDPDRERGLVDFLVRFTHGRVECIRRLEVGESPRGAPPPQSWRIERPVPLSTDANAIEGPRTDQDRPTPPAAPEPQAHALSGHDEDRAAERRLLANLRRDRAELQTLLESCDGHWGAEDAVYRFYHQSYKVYALQQATEAIVERLRALAPDCELHPGFSEIVDSGTGLEFELAHNQRWLEVTRPIVEAFFHASYFLEMSVRYGSLEQPPSPLPSGWAALLHLYGLR